MVVATDGPPSPNRRPPLAARVRALFDAAMDAREGPARRGLLEAADTDDPSAASLVRAMLAADGTRVGPLVDVATLLTASGELGRGADGTCQDPEEQEADGMAWSPAPLLTQGEAIGTPAGRGVVEALLSATEQRQLAEVYRVGLEGGGRIALKVLRASAAGPTVRARFRFEAEALRRVEHPAVARLLAAGMVHRASGERLPAIAMQLVDGEPLDGWSAGRPAAEVARAVAAVARAAHHAHLRGVVHRDIKPANILVDRDDRPVLLDLGVARLLGAGEGGVSPEVSTLGGIVGTPRYMAPEQLAPATRGVDLRADVYALGLVLHELLAGRELVSVAGLSQAEALARKLAPPPAPPRGLSVRDQLLVVARCAASPDPDDRHQSAEALADDIARALAGRPLAVRPPGRLRRGLLFARRNRGLLAAGLAVGVALAIAAAVYAAGQHEVARERDRAQARFDDARDFARWVIFDLADELSLVAGTTALRAELVSQASGTLDRLAADPIASDSLLLELAEASTRLSEIMVHEVGDFRGSIEPLSRARHLLGRLRNPSAPMAQMLENYLTYRWRMDAGHGHPGAAPNTSARSFAPLLERMVALEPAMAHDSRYWRWRSTMRWYYARRLHDEAAPPARVLAFQQRAIEDAQRALALAPDDPLARTELAKAWYFRAYAIGESAAHTPEQYAQAAADALPLAASLDDAGHPRGGYFIGRCTQLLADAHARQGDWQGFARWADRSIRAVDRAAAALPGHLLMVRFAEVCRIRLAGVVRDAGPGAPTPIVASALARAHEAIAMLRARRERGWLGPVEDGPYDALYADVADELAATLAASAGKPGEPTPPGTPTTPP